MTTSRPSALQNTAIFAGGALAGAGLYSLARSLVASKQAPAGADAAKPAAAVLEPAANEAPQPTTAEPQPSPGADFVPPSQSDDLYDECGVMGIPYEARAQLPPVDELATHMDLEHAHPLLPTHVTSQAQFDMPVLANTQLAIEMLAYAHSGVVFSYESSVSGGFGAYCEAQERAAQAGEAPRTGAKVYSMQARAGAGNAIAGFLLGEGTASAPAAVERARVTALVNAQSFQAMGPALASMDATNRHNLVVHVSTASQSTSDELLVTNDYAATLSTAALLGDAGFEVVLSSTRAEAIECAHYAYTRQADKPLVHIFEGAYAGSEVGRVVVPGAKAKPASALAPFAYTGPASPDTVLVLPNGSLSLAARALLVSLSASLRGKVGVVSVRQLYPWNASELVRALPSSVRTVRVVEEAYAALGGALYAHVLESWLGGAFGARSVDVQSLVLSAGELLSPEEWHALLSAAASSPAPLSLAQIRAERTDAALVDLLSLSSAQLVTFVGGDKGATVAAARLLADWLFADNASLHVRLLTRYDNYHASGTVRADLVVSERASDIPLPLLTRRGASHAVVVSEPSTLLPSFQALDALREKGTVLLNAGGWAQEDVEGALFAADQQLLAQRDATLYVVDAAQAAHALVGRVDAHATGKGKTGDAPSAADLTASVLAASVVSAVAVSSQNALASRLPKLARVASHAGKTLAGAAEEHTHSIDTHAFANATDEHAERAAERLASLAYNSFQPVAGEEEASSSVVRASWAFAAWQLLFREAYALESRALRPDLPEKTYDVTVSVNKRLTPLEYDRNLFHMELDTRGTGLKYEVGEALGVHGWNDDEEVARFIRWIGYNPEEIVSVPSVIHPGEFESRTVYQVLQQNLDLFGKPPKSFFEALGKAVASKDEERWLRFISFAEGASTFKKLSEDETVTYADVLHMFPTAHVSIDWLVEHVEPIKPRHYSIASAQVAVGDSVHLLIVTVDWKTPRGSTRYGQCTRYLSRLTPGTKVTVSIKPSVMKLPPLDTQPIIMAGLGTGAAPFRAFLQARAYQRAQGKEVGPMYYYFGSRHQAAEYLYGEELEAYLSDGLLTHLGLAFSRDQAKKVYIQHKIKEDGRQLTAFLAPELGDQPSESEKVAEALDHDGRKGVFTLCGPVWPVPDIQEALVTAFIERGWTKEQAEAHLEQLKDEERYVLEVY